MLASQSSPQLKSELCGTQSQVKVIHTGSITLWRHRITIDVVLVHHKCAKAIEVVVKHPDHSTDQRIYVDRERVDKKFDILELDAQISQRRELSLRQHKEFDIDQCTEDILLAFSVKYLCSRITLRSQVTSPSMARSPKKVVCFRAELATNFGDTAVEDPGTGKSFHDAVLLSPPAGLIPYVEPGKPARRFSTLEVQTTLAQVAADRSALAQMTQQASNMVHEGELSLQALSIVIDGDGNDSRGNNKSSKDTEHIKRMCTGESTNNTKRRNSHVWNGDTESSLRRRGSVSSAATAETASPVKSNKPLPLRRPSTSHATLPSPCHRGSSSDNGSAPVDGGSSAQMQTGITRRNSVMSRRRSSVSMMAALPESAEDTAPVTPLTVNPLTIPEHGVPTPAPSVSLDSAPQCGQQLGLESLQSPLAGVRSLHVPAPSTAAMALEGPETVLGPVPIVAASSDVAVGQRALSAMNMLSRASSRLWRQGSGRLLPAVSMDDRAAASESSSTAEAENSVSGKEETKRPRLLSASAKQATPMQTANLRSTLRRSTLKPLFNDASSSSKDHVEELSRV